MTKLTKILITALILMSCVSTSPSVMLPKPPEYPALEKPENLSEIDRT